ncbi:MAG: hypothetical protein WEC36_05730 [Phycisphaeraceae bacterium]
MLLPMLLLAMLTGGTAWADGALVETLQTSFVLLGVAIFCVVSMAQHNMAQAGCGCGCLTMMLPSLLLGALINGTSWENGLLAGGLHATFLLMGTAVCLGMFLLHAWGTTSQRRHCR